MRVLKSCEILHSGLDDLIDFDLFEGGKVSVDEKVITTFSESEDGQHRYLTANDVQKARVKEILVAFASEPPD